MMSFNLDVTNLVPRVLSYPPYVGRVGENPGNEVEMSRGCARSVEKQTVACSGLFQIKPIGSGDENVVSLPS